MTYQKVKQITVEEEKWVTGKELVRLYIQLLLFSILTFGTISLVGGLLVHRAFFQIGIVLMLFFYIQIPSVFIESKEEFQQFAKLVNKWWVAIPLPIVVSLLLFTFRFI